MPRFFVERTNEHTAVISGTDAHHLRTVLRLRPGDKLTVIDGAQQEFQAELTAYEGERALVRLLSPEMLAREARLDVYLVQGIAKGEKMDWIVQKAVELGVAGVIPLDAKHSVVKIAAEKEKSRCERWQRIAAEAAKQCCRLQVPVVYPVTKLADVWKLLPIGCVCLFCDEAAAQGEALPGMKQTLRALTDAAAVAVFVGPEGGFSREEALQAVSQGAQRVSLGPRVLRTETAAIAAVTMVMYELADIGGEA